MDTYDILRSFEDISALFKVLYFEPLWRKYNLNDSMDAASLFLEGYAFERQGRSPAFSPAAVEAIRKSKRTKGSNDFPLTIWDNFCNLLNNEGLNHKLNPLYPQYPLYHPTSSCNCIWCVLNPYNSDSIIVSSKQALESGQIKDAWERLKKIQGVGPKISSLFLRDVAIWYKLPLSNKSPFLKDDNRWLLQPIDIWVKRITIALNKKDMKYEEVAKWIVESCDRPEDCNQGMWYFGAKIAQTEFRLENYLDDPQTAIEQHIKALTANAYAILEFKRR